MKRIMDGDPLIVYGDGEQTRDFLFVDDLCDAVVAALARRPTGGLFQLGTGVETSVNELVRAARRADGRPRGHRSCYEPERRR